MKILLLVLSFAFLNGCASDAVMLDLYKKASAGAIGCLPDEIDLADVDMNKFCPSISSWVATCKGKHFVCSFTCKPEGTPATNCKERLN